MKKVLTTMLTVILMMMLALPVYAEELAPAGEENLTITESEATTQGGAADTHVHKMSNWVVSSQPTCATDGSEERHCTDPACPDANKASETRSIPALGHIWGPWTGAVAATVFSGGVNTQTCSRCGAQNQEPTASLTPFVSWAHKVSKLPRKSKETFSVNLANGDYVTKWKSSKKKIASVSAAGVVKAKKTGKTKITAYTASGEKISCTVKVVKASKKTKKGKKKKTSSHGGTVYWTPSGSVYHRSDSCPTLSRSRTVYSGSVKESGKSRCCKVCG